MQSAWPSVSRRPPCRGATGARGRGSCGPTSWGRAGSLGPPDLHLTHATRTAAGAAQPPLQVEQPRVARPTPLQARDRHAGLVRALPAHGRHHVAGQEIAEPDGVQRAERRNAVAAIKSVPAFMPGKG